MRTDLHEDVLDDPAALEAGDPKGMLRDVATSGAQVRNATAATAEAGIDVLVDGGRPRAIVVAGMGGSGISGDVLAAVAGMGCPVPLVVHRGFGLPGWVGAADLVMAVSCSGTTEETLSCAEEAVRRGARLLGIGAASSPLADVATQASAPYVAVRVPDSGQPRAALWSLAIPLVILADRMSLLTAPASSVEATADRLDEWSQRCRPGSETFVNPAKTLAVDLAGSLPMIWGSSALAGVAAYRFACQLNENSKYPAISGKLPEAGHNQIVAFDGPLASAGGEADFFRDRIDEPEATASLRLIMLADPDEHPRVAARRTAIIEIAEERGVSTTEIVPEGATPLERLASFVALGDYTSVYLALLLGIDPTAIAPIVDLKARVAR